MDRRVVQPREVADRCPLGGDVSCLDESRHGAADSWPARAMRAGDPPCTMTISSLRSDVDQSPPAGVRTAVARIVGRSRGRSSDDPSRHGSSEGLSGARRRIRGSVTRESNSSSSEPPTRLQRAPRASAELTFQRRKAVEHQTGVDEIEVPPRAEGSVHDVVATEPRGARVRSTISRNLRVDIGGEDRARRARPRSASHVAIDPPPASHPPGIASRRSGLDPVKCRLVPGSKHARQRRETIGASPPELSSRYVRRRWISSWLHLIPVVGHCGLGGDRGVRQERDRHGATTATAGRRVGQTCGRARAPGMTIGELGRARPARCREIGSPRCV